MDVNLSGVSIVPFPICQTESESFRLYVSGLYHPTRPQVALLGEPLG